MNQSFSLPTALCLPVPDIEALIQGQTIAVLPEMFLRPGQRFYLYPVEISTVEIDKYYRKNFLPIAKTAWGKFHKPGILLQPQQLNLIETNQQLQLPLSQNNLLIKAWAKCELCRTLDKTESLDILSQITIWKTERFEEILQNLTHFFLAYLRVYHLDKPLEIPIIPNIQEKLGKFAPFCIKIIMAAGDLTKDAELTAKGNKMNVIRPETLQRLVELKAKHPGSIDLLNLKQYLENEPFGEKADDEIHEYIKKVEKEIKLRSHIIQVLKNYLQLSQNESAKVESLHAIYVTSNPPKNLDDRELYNILIELSSPLTGYLGRIKENYWKKDRFYYLRDLSIN
ncbi:MAG: hypothetical protein RLZZ507_2289 [Cyanobacteriota bacterium]|jgi:hypothetical protein